LKILHVIANLSIKSGGPSQACLHMAAAVAALGHEVWIYTANQDVSEETSIGRDQVEISNGVNIRYFPLNRPRFWGTSWRLGAALCNDIPSFDVVHVHSLYLFHDWVASRACLKNDIPYIVRPHGTLDPFLYSRHRFRKRVMEWVFQNKALQGAAAIHFTSNDEQELAAQYCFGRPGIIVPNGVELPSETPEVFRSIFFKKHPELVDARIVLFFGRINFKKGLDILVNAFEKVKAKDAVLLIVGPDNEGYGKRVRGWVKNLGVGERVIFKGLVAGSEKWEVLSAADIFVLSSYTENFGISVVEAMGMKIPVVISDKVNIWREIKAANAGVVVPCDVDATATAIDNLLLDSDLASKMGGNGRYEAEKTFNWETVGAQLEMHYKKLISFRSGSSKVLGVDSQ